MTNEELAALLQDGSGGEDELLCLWDQVRRFAASQARRWARASTGVEVEDLLQAGFLAFMDALGTWNRDAGMFITWYSLRLKGAFTEAVGLRTARQRNDPLRGAVSLDAQVGRDADDPLTLLDVLEDPRRSGQCKICWSGILPQSVPGCFTCSWINWTKRSGRRCGLFTASASQFPRQPPGSSWTRQPCAALPIPACDFSADLQTPGSCWACGHKQRHPFF